MALSGTRRGGGGARKWSSGLLTTANANMGNLAEEGGAWGSGPRMELLTPPEPFYRRLRPWSAPRSALPYSPPFHTREGTVGERGGAEVPCGREQCQRRLCKEAPAALQQRSKQLLGVNPVACNQVNFLAAYFFEVHSDCLSGPHS